ncbi:MAG: Putative stomatin/prohibitin-family membrane protease subunit aq_911 [uncultured Thermomicrobiales bacterium]|uniref:Stomatin/prohibitin-family membrane protease subunit aq_911 n=1 Tax=uncultured Thermomicrobiales bacterium TaxID=1645740 RepID=A0A6J4VJB6_9BACT|nr:MAG: Putative stomatin/prohibitin-family membrane protease subunit aq_911 [uncultured Thermomicrobiales bacterium]
MEVLGVLILILGAFAMLVLFSAVKVVQEYERGVVFRLGRLLGPRGPGLILLIPFVERMTKVDLRTVTMDIPSQEVITRDNVTVRVNAVAYFRVLDPNAAVTNVADFVRATSQIAQTTLRSVLGQSELDDLLSEREKINQDLQRIIDDQTEPWGIKVSVVEVKDVELPPTMQRAMARQAEAEREKRAKIIHAEGEFQASQQLARAADVINLNPVTIQLRYLQTLTEIGAEQNTTIVFPLPIDLLGSMVGANGAARPSTARPSTPAVPSRAATPAAPTAATAPTAPSTPAMPAPRVSPAERPTGDE